ncbi:MAG: oligopeptide/dipeptide ABC transporter ATP-binding protein [Christensenellales bacterium]|nr:oligopeptide/dipeptide ABC transporter ATP-binding protein [Christensenellales bacterium]
MMHQPLIEIRNLKMYFPVGAGLLGRRKTLKAVDDVSFDLYPGETFGLVGESGCGKTTLGRSLVRLYQPTGGQILFKGDDISGMDERTVLPYRKKMQMIFQDPYAALNPRMTVYSIIAEPMRLQNYSPADIKMRVLSLIQQVGLKQNHLNRYPHEFSGGQRQRIGIARALATNPEFIVCDEPVSALDVSIQAQVINMLEELQQQQHITYLFVSHDLSMVRHISHRVGVMYLGHLVELAPVDELYSNMLHPYTQALMSAVPIADPDLAARSKRIVLQGDVPAPIDPPDGCPFASRCRYCKPLCTQQRPKLRDLGGGHLLACHLVG